MVDLPTFINFVSNNRMMLNSEFKLLKAFLKAPSKELYGRQIDRLTGINHERAVAYENKLVNEYKVLIREKKGRQVFYRLNKQSEIAQKALSVAELERKIEFLRKNKRGTAIQSLVSEMVEMAGAGVYFVVLFGSMARGQAREASDIDLLFVLLEEKETRSRLDGFVRRMIIATPERLSFHPITLSELEKQWHKEPIYRNIWDERIVLFGEQNFWQFVLKNGEPHG